MSAAYRSELIISSLNYNSLAGSQIGEMAYGFDIRSRDDPRLKVAEDAMACARELMSAGSFLVDSFPLRQS